MGTNWNSMVGMKKEERGGKKEEGMPGKQKPADVLTGSFSGNTGFTQLQHQMGKCE